MRLRQINLKLAAAIGGLVVASGAAAQSPAAGSDPVSALLPRHLEIELALSALPPHLRGEAVVYVLNPLKGFERVREGTNGFHALVARTGDDAFRGSWPLSEYRDDILYPIAFDSAGAEAILPVFFDAAELQANGVPSQALKTTMQERFATGYYKPPARPGVSYMLSPVLRTYTEADRHAEVATVSYPHIMHYAPNLSASDIGGAELGSAYPFLIFQGVHGYTIQALGAPEREAINREHAVLIGKLCELRTEWCLPGRVIEAAVQHRSH